MREFEQMEMQFLLNQELKKIGLTIGKKKTKLAFKSRY